MARGSTSNGIGQMPGEVRYTPALQDELAMLDSVFNSASNYCGYVRELAQAVTGNDKETAQAVLQCLFPSKGPPVGINQGWNETFGKIRHLIEAVSKPFTLQLPRWQKPTGYERAEWFSEELEARLRVAENVLWKDTFQSAHEAVVVLPLSIISALRRADLSGDEKRISVEEWSNLRAGLAEFVANNFSQLREALTAEHADAAKYARESAIQPRHNANSPDPATDEFDVTTLPESYKEGAKPDGEPLVVPYLTESIDWQLTASSLAGARRDKKVKSVKVRIGGKLKDAHEFASLAAYRLTKTRREDGER